MSEQALSVKAMGQKALSSGKYVKPRVFPKQSKLPTALIPISKFEFRISRLEHLILIGRKRITKHANHLSVRQKYQENCPEKNKVQKVEKVSKKSEKFHLRLVLESGLCTGFGLDFTEIGELICHSRRGRSCGSCRFKRMSKLRAL